MSPCPVLTSPNLMSACCRSAWQQALARLPWTPAARALALQKNVSELWARQQSDDLLYIFLSVIDAYITKARQACPKALLSWTLLRTCREGCRH